MTLSLFDAALLLVVFVLTIRGAITGFVSEFFSKAAVVLGLLGAVLFYRKLSPYVERVVGPDIFPEVVAFLVLFIAIYLVIKLFQQLAGNVMQGETMTGLDRALGVFFGFAEGIVVIAVIIIVIHTQTWFAAERILSGSLIDRLFAPLVTQGPSVISGFLNGMN